MVKMTFLQFHKRLKAKLSEREGSIKTQISRSKKSNNINNKTKIKSSYLKFLQNWHNLTYSQSVDTNLQKPSCFQLFHWGDKQKNPKATPHLIYNLYKYMWNPKSQTNKIIIPNPLHITFHGWSSIQLLPNRFLLSSSADRRRQPPAATSCHSPEGGRRNRRPENHHRGSRDRQKSQSNLLLCIRCLGSH